MRTQSQCVDIDVWAGTIVTIRAEASAPAGSTVSVNPSTAWAAVTDINDVSESLAVEVSYNFDDSAVIVETSWEIPDDQPGGVYTVTFDIDGSLVGATERSIRVRQRTLATSPA